MRWTIIPMRGLGRGKLRLAGYLDDELRRCLNKWLLEQVLSAVEQLSSGLERCIVAAGDEDVAQLARRRGASVLITGELGLNESLELARRAVRLYGADQILALVSDLPNVTARALHRLIEAVPSGGAAVIADKERIGTAGVLLPASCGMPFMFGPRSLDHHCRGLVEHGVEPMVWTDPALSFDLDTPQDYSFWRGATALVELDHVSHKSTRQGVFEV